MKTRNDIILSYQPLVNRIAAQYAPLLASMQTSAITIDDLIQEGNLGLITAIDRGKAPMPFIIKFILEAIRCHANILTRPCHCHKTLLSISTDHVLYREEGDPITLADTLPDDSSPISELISKEQLQRLQKAIASLSPREQSILNDLYGLSSDPLNIAQAAAKYQLSECNIRQIHSRACHKIHLLP